MIKSTPKTLFLIAGAVLAISICAFYFNLSETIIHYFINLFAGGRSTIKIFGYTAFTLTLCVMVWPPVLSKLSKIKIKTKWLLISLATTFLYGLVLLQIFSSRLGVKASEYIVTIHNGELSTTTLMHNHLMKGFTGLISSQLGEAVQENIDTGLAYVGLLPDWLFWLGGLLVLISTVLILLKFTELYQHEKKWQGLFIILYSIIAFGLIKNTIDGGLFNRETPILISALLFLLWRKTEASSRFMIWVVLPAALYFILGPLLNVAGIVEIYNLPASLFAAASLTVILITLFYWLKQQKTDRLGVLLAILSLILIYAGLAESLNNYLGQKQNISSDGAYVAAYQDINEPGWIKLESINNLRTYNFVPSEPTTSQDLIEKYKLLDNLGPIRLPWAACMPTAAGVAEFTLASPTPLTVNSIHSEFVNFVKIEPLPNSTPSLHYYQATVMVSHCAPRPLNIIQELLEQQGLDTFYLFGLRESVNPPNLYE